MDTPKKRTHVKNSEGVSFILENGTALKVMDNVINEQVYGKQNLFAKYITKSSQVTYKVPQDLQQNGIDMLKFTMKTLRSGTPMHRHYEPAKYGPCTNQVKARCVDKTDIMYLAVETDTSIYGGHKCEFELTADTKFLVMGYRDIFQLLVLSLLQRDYPSHSFVKQFPKLPDPMSFITIFFGNYPISLDNAEEDIRKFVDGLTTMYRIGRDPVYDNKDLDSSLLPFIDKTASAYYARSFYKNRQSFKIDDDKIIDDNRFYTQLRAFVEYIGCDGIISPRKLTRGMGGHQRSGEVFIDEFIVYNCRNLQLNMDTTNEIAKQIAELKQQILKLESADAMLKSMSVRARTKKV